MITVIAMVPEIGEAVGEAVADVDGRGMTADPTSGLPIVSGIPPVVVRVAPSVMAMEIDPGPTVKGRVKG